jgi:3-oxoacyl-[acyl-carrier-protein] synthase-3
VSELPDQVKIKGVSIAHPKTKYDNQFFIDHFNALGLKAEGLMNHLGRKERYLVDPEKENTITMAIDAAQKALASTNTRAEELDMIVFVSDTPEYTYPSNALILNRKLGANNAHIVYDMNANCIGMLSAIDQVNVYLKSRAELQKALIIGSVYVSNIIRKDDTVMYPNFSDGACAVVMEKTLENIGLVASNYHTDATLADFVMYPSAGFSQIFNENISVADKKLRFDPHDVSFFSDEWKKLITAMLNKHNVQASEIDHWIFSQFSRPEVEETLLKLKVGLDNYTFVGEEYGYTGVTSPIFALHDALERKRIRKGDKVVFCSVAVGYSMSSLLYQF